MRGFRPQTGLAAGVGVVCVSLGLARAWQFAWVNDDAFISFRYARNLVDGAGLVFNVGERVEGFTNLLWTLWCALGIRVGIDPVAWALVSGAACYGAALGLLAWNHLKLRRSLGVTGWTLPAGAAIGVLAEDWNVYATGGLETSLFSLLALIGLLLLTTPDRSTRSHAAFAGIVLGLASLTRPDGAVFFAVCVIFVAFESLRQRDPVRLLALGAGFLALWLPATVWRVAYYGDLLPNTYYAKSAYLAWYSQGWHYLRLFLMRYWALAALAPLAFLALRRDPGRAARQSVLAAGCAVAYTLYVVRVGGDFMFARLLVPVLPFLAVLGDVALTGLAPRIRWLQPCATALLASALLITPSPIPGKRVVHGIADERRHYSEEEGRRIDAAAATLQDYLAGLDVRVAFSGSQARLVYGAEVPVAIECETGLTDRRIARQRLVRRGRPGHEKHAPWEYVVLERGAHFAFRPYTLRITGADRALPVVPIDFDDVRGYILHWDPALLEELRRRGARFPDYPKYLDEVLAELDRMPPEQVRKIYQQASRFYFEHVADPRRQGALEARLVRP